MIDIKTFIESLENGGVEFVSGVPDTLLNDFCLYIDHHWRADRHILAANEGNAVALAAGYHLSTGTIPLVYMQNSGIGNAVNPLISLTHKEVYSIPILLLVGWRGDPSRKDHAQHKKQGEITPDLLRAMDIPYQILENETEDVLEKAKWALRKAKELNSPVALIVKKGVLEKGEKESFKNDGTFSLSREEAINILIDSVPKDSIFVGSTGRITRELYELRNFRGESHEWDFLNVGAMGHTSSIAMGIAVANTNRLVVCLDGDSSAIMHLGALTTAGNTHLPNFLHVVLNNGVHESVGGQASAGFSIDLTGIAQSSGYKTANRAVETKKGIQNSLKNLLTGVGPFFIDLHIRKGIRSDLPALKYDLKHTKEKFIEGFNTAK